MDFKRFNQFLKDEAVYPMYQFGPFNSKTHSYRVETNYYLSSKSENLWFDLEIGFDKERNQQFFEIVLDDLVGELLDYNDFDVNLAFDDDEDFSNHLRNNVRDFLKHDSLQYRL